MAANICRTYLKREIGLSTDEQANAVMAEGISDLGSFALFSKDDIKTLCSSVRKPGGTIPDPNATVAVGATRPTISNPGFRIPAICESRLIDAAYTFSRSGKTARRRRYHKISKKILSSTPSTYGDRLLQ